MKRYPKIVQCDSRGQIVIPKDIRHDLHIDEGTGFWMYSVTNEGILLKKIDVLPLEENKQILDEIDSKSDKIKVKKSNLVDAMKKYKKTKEGNLEVL
jgi:AbrB family looped-hinge helix DNA binding protein